MLLNCGVREDSLRVPWTARRSNQSILKEISPGCSLEGLMLTLKLHTLATWCEELTHLKRPWCWERLKGGEGTTEDEMVGWLYWVNGHEFAQALGVGDGQGRLVCCGSWGCKVSDATEQLNWTEKGSRFNLNLFFLMSAFSVFSCGRRMCVGNGGWLGCGWGEEWGTASY